MELSIRRKHRKPDMHVQCSSVAARLHHTRPHVMVAHIRGANQCPSQLYQRNERTYRCLSQRWPHRSDGLSSFAHRAGLQDLGVRRPGLTPLRSQQPLGLTIMVGLVRAHGQVAVARSPASRRTAITGRSAICIAANWRYRERSSSCARSCSSRRAGSQPSTQHHPA